jgi:hypothetical protein
LANPFGKKNSLKTPNIGESHKKFERIPLMITLSTNIQIASKSTLKNLLKKHENQIAILMKSIPSRYAKNHMDITANKLKSIPVAVNENTTKGIKQKAIVNSKSRSEA